METVQLQCGNCSKVMAISTDHLGGQVRCPHCLTVVQTPPRQQPAGVPIPAPALEPEVLPPKVEPGEVESIFAPDEPSDDLFGGGPQRPLVEMPSEVENSEPARIAADATADAPPYDPLGMRAGSPQAPADEAPSAESDAADLSSLRRPQRAIFDRSYLSLMGFVFLIPYSVLSTIIIFYLMYQLANQPHPLEILPDPVPKDKKGPREVERIKHDQPLAEHLKVPLKGNVVIGALMVTPMEVGLNEFGELRLLLHVKNVSTNQAFSPMHEDFLKIAKGPRPVMPYSFLDSAKFVRLYDEHLAFRRGAAEDLTRDGELLPGQEEDILLTTKGNKEIIKKMVESPGEQLTWRVQLRRGLVEHRRQKISATAVIGVQFNAADIKKM